MGITQLVQLVERLLDFRIDPRRLAIPGLLGANRDHIGKGRVGGHPEAVGSYGFAQRTRHPELVERDDRPVLGFHPEGFRIIPGVGHRENSRRIGFDQKIEINGHETAITLSASFAQSEIYKDCGPSAAINTRASSAIFSAIAAYSLEKPALVRQAAPMLRVTSQPSTLSKATSPPRASSDRT